MTLPHERKRAVEEVREFLCRLTRPSASPRVPAWVRQEARLLLRHYPLACDLKGPNFAGEG